MQFLEKGGWLSCPSFVNFASLQTCEIRSSMVTKKT